jgi:hypothetical protein
MNRAAENQDVGERAVLAAERVTDPGTLARVAASLLAQLGGRMPEAPVIEGPAGQLDRRTVTPLSHVRRDAG